MKRIRTGARVRAEAAIAVDAVVTRGKSLDTALASAAEFIDPADNAQLRNLCYGTLRRHWPIRAWLAALLDRPLRARDSVIESLICVGLYQLAETRVPDHAAVSMTVEAARLLRQPKFAALINAVLRNFRRRNIEDREPPDGQARYSHPGWLIDSIANDWPGHWQGILEANNRRAPMWLRVNQRQHSTEEYLSLLDASDSEMPGDERHTLLDGVDTAIRLVAPRPVSELPGFYDGAVSVQDAAAQIAAIWLGAGERERILDACAAPGGKTGHLLELAGKASSLTAVDSDAERLRRVEENNGRLRLSATLVHGDASNPKAWWDGRPFDRILLDAPCSATGVIRRHPDIKLLRRPADVETLAALQQRLLHALWPLLAEGGKLLYATCSVLARENDGVIAGFLQQTPNAGENRVLPNNNIRDLMQEKVHGYQVLPGSSDLDGFYFACLQKDDS